MSADHPSSPPAADPADAIEAFRLRFRAALQKIGATRSSIWPEYWPSGPLIRIVVKAPAGVQLPERLDPIGVVRFAETGEFTSPLDWRVSAERIGLNEPDAVLLRSASDLDEQSAWRDMLTDEMQRRPSDGSESSGQSRQRSTPWTTSLTKLGEKALEVLMGLVGLVLIVALIQGFRSEPFPVPSYDVFKSAFAPCKTYVRARLPTPVTASFPSRHSGDVETRSFRIQGGDRLEVISYVDAENTFGAVVRTRFYCSVDRIGRTGFGGAFEPLVALFLSQRPWPLVDLRMAPWAATTPEDRSAQAGWAIAAGDRAFLRDLAADWIRIDPSDPKARVADAVSRYWDRDFSHISRTMSEVVMSSRAGPPAWDRTAKAVYAGALAEQGVQGQRDLGAEAAIAAFLATKKPSLFSQAWDTAFEEWARVTSTSKAAR